MCNESSQSFAVGGGFALVLTHTVMLLSNGTVAVSQGIVAFVVSRESVLVASFANVHSVGLGQVCQNISVLFKLLFTVNTMIFFGRETAVNRPHYWPYLQFVIRTYFSC